MGISSELAVASSGAAHALDPDIAAAERKLAAADELLSARSWADRAEEDIVELRKRLSDLSDDTFRVPLRARLRRRPELTTQGIALKEAAEIALDPEELRRVRRAVETLHAELRTIGGSREQWLEDLKRLENEMTREALHRLNASWWREELRAHGLDSSSGDTAKRTMLREILAAAVEGGGTGAHHDIPVFATHPWAGSQPTGRLGRANGHRGLASLPAAHAYMQSARMLTGRVDAAVHSARIRVDHQRSLITRVKDDLENILARLQSERVHVGPLVGSATGTGTGIEDADVMSQALRPIRLRVEALERGDEPSARQRDDAHAMLTELLADDIAAFNTEVARDSDARREEELADVRVRLDEAVSSAARLVEARALLAATNTMLEGRIDQIDAHPDTLRALGSLVGTLEGIVDAQSAMLDGAASLFQDAVRNL